LAKDNAEKEKIDQIRKEFVSNVSHEIKTPLALIQGYAEGLKSNVMENEADKEFYCNVIIDEVARMNKLVRDLLNLSHIESGSYQLEPEEFDLVELVELALEKYKLKFKEEGVLIQQEGPNSILVKADYFHIEQVFLNYLNNALHHADERKTIKITVTGLAKKVKVSVFNYGKPIPEEDLDQIWLSFFKVDKARTRSDGGTGLGLAIVKAIMEQHRNQYGVLNHEDGVEFWFEVDRAEDGSQ
jgi:signal transduction histidine kinase